MDSKKDKPEKKEIIQDKKEPKSTPRRPPVTHINHSRRIDREVNNG